MKGTRATTARISMALFCSLLLAFQTAFAAQSHSLTGPAHSKAGVAPKLIAVADVTGTAERNGSPLLNGAIVSSGDLVSTRGHSAVLLASAPEERLWLGADTSAKLSKHGGEVAVALERGTLGFQTRGHIQVTLGHHSLALRSRAGSMAVAELHFISDRLGQVRLQKGSLELVQNGHSIPLQTGQSRLISSVGASSFAESPTKGVVRSPSQGNANANTGTVTGTVVNSQTFVVSGASVTLTSSTGSTFKAVTDAQGRFAFQNVPAGTYTLRVVSAGSPNYEMSDLVVTDGKVSTAYVQLAGGGKKSHALIIGLVAGGGAAAGLGVWAATKKKSTTPSPSVP